MTERLDFPSEGIAAACAELYSRFGTTLAGLVVRLVLRRSLERCQACAERAAIVAPARARRKRQPAITTGLQG